MGGWFLSSSFFLLAVCTVGFPSNFLLRLAFWLWEGKGER